jgi:hypothetical protein
MQPTQKAVSYVVPLRADAGTLIDELAAYLTRLAAHVDDVLVVDGSEPELVEQHRALLEPAVRVLVPEQRTRNGKVGNVDTGVRNARREHVVLADDDVRYTAASLQGVIALLDDHDVVRPQNYFDTWPWHARFDGARTLLNRVSGGDWPGTLAVRRSTYLRMGGYAGDVLFENLELVRTVRAHGGRAADAADVFVARRPPTTRHFRGQQIRQAYDELARPGRLLVFLAVLPVTAIGLARRRFRALAAGGAVIAAAAEVGRRRDGARTRFPASSAALAPLWVLWRSACSWAAIGARLRGGVRYREQRIRRAASTPRQLRRVIRRRAA